jgi:outer membrane lipoprotein SlyB
MSRSDSEVPADSGPTTGEGAMTVGGVITGGACGKAEAGGGGRIAITCGAVGGATRGNAVCVAMGESTIEEIYIRASSGSGTWLSRDAACARGGAASLPPGVNADGCAVAEGSTG